MFSKQQMAERAAQEIDDGALVNLGIGLPTLVADYLPAPTPDGGGVWLQRLAHIHLKALDKRFNQGVFHPGVIALGKLTRQARQRVLRQGVLK